MMRAIVMGAAALWLFGCGSSLPPPTIRAVSPSEIAQGEMPTMRVETDAVFSFDVDYGARSTSVATGVVVLIGGIPLSAPAVGADGAITGIVPFALPTGTHDVVVQLSDGRSATLPGGFTVKPGAFPDSFTIDRIPDQRRGVPFTITVRAVGGRASEFKGVVALDVNRGGITPAISGPFSGSVLRQEVTLSNVSSNSVITVRDAAGHTGQSNGFRVGP